MAFVQIATQNFSYSREDGSQVVIKVTFEEDGGTSQTWNVPIEAEAGILTAEGEVSDAPNKPIKTSRASFTLQAAPGNGTGINLIDRLISNFAPQRFRVTITEQGSGFIYFKGYVVRGLSRRKVYSGGMKVLRVECTGGFALMRQTQVGSLAEPNPTLDVLADQIGSAIGTDRPLDFYSAIHPDELTETDSIPTLIRANVFDGVGGDSGSLYTFTESFLYALGMQCAVINDRLTFIGLIDRVFLADSVRKHEDQGGGTYTTSLEDVRVSIDETAVFEDAQEEPVVPPETFEVNYQFITRDDIDWDDPSPVSLTGNGGTSDHTHTVGLAVPSDELNITASGRLLSAGNGPATGTFEYLELFWEDHEGNRYWYDPSGFPSPLSDTPKRFSTSFSFTGSGGETEDWSVDVDMPPPPEGTICKAYIRVVLDVTFSSGDMSDIQNQRMTASNMFHTPSDEFRTRAWRESSPDVNADAPEEDRGKIIRSPTYVGSEDPFSSQQAIQYVDSGFHNTVLWDGRLLGDLIARNLGDIIVGMDEPGFHIRFEESQAPQITLLSLVQYEGKTCVPISIKRELFSGFISVFVRPYNERSDNSADVYI